MRKTRWPVGLAVVAAMVCTALGLPTPATAASTAAATATAYPNPLPDFSHPGSPHAPLFKKHQLPPMLVVYGTFDDLTNLSESAARDKFFPIFTFGNVADYYLQNGLGVLTPVQETYGDHDNGIVMVNLGQSSSLNGQDVTVRRRKMMELADPYVDFARYDANNDGTVDDSELAVVTLVTSPTADYSCGQTANVGAGGKLDGKNIGFRTADGGSLTNNLTFAHELTHQQFQMEDFYGFGVGDWDIAGPTCAGSTQIWQEPNAWHRLHLTGSQPNIITKDRYITLLPDTVAPYQSYLLYDPARGTDDYFMLEERAAKTGTYDQNIPDNGMVIWRIDERHVRNSPEHLRGVELMRPDGVRSPGCLDDDVDGKVDEDPADGVDNDGDGKVDEDGPHDGCNGGNDTDAWDPTDSRTRQREMTQPWADGTPAGVAVRAIGENFADQRQAYVDVPGPGILVDAGDINGHAPQPQLTAGSTVDLSFAVMNTGEATDTFDFTELVPTGWTATTQRMTLTAGQRATAKITVTVGTDEAAGARHTLIARGRSTTDSAVQTDYSMLVDINRESAVAYTGDTTVEQSDTAHLSVKVTDKLSGAPLANNRVRISSGHDTVATAVTGADGVATATLPPGLAPGSYDYTVIAKPNGDYLGSTTSFTLVVGPEKATLAVTSPTTYADDQPTPMTVKVTDEADGEPADLSKAVVQLQVRNTLTGETRSYSANAGADGVATLPVDVPSGTWAATASLSGGYFTGPAVQTELIVFDPDGQITGAALGPDSTGTQAVLTASARYLNRTPSGAVTLTAGSHVFTGTTLRWLAVSGTAAAFEITGRVGTPARNPAGDRASQTEDGRPLHGDRHQRRLDVQHRRRDGSGQLVPDPDQLANHPQLD
ncbi:NEW3 domain-containing protein [Kribbella sp. NPDC026611]|uniref:NEW3 domain-containing protein n=1 Tax=Kribbella sp. NPDC026611 TaxID=3154911 RepID=UPI0033EFD10A